MIKLLKKLIIVSALAFSFQAIAHHSFAIYDFETQIPFDGVVESLKFRNPHIEMTIKAMNDDGEEVIIHFIEGAPANMMVRSGVKPDLLKPGTVVHAVGSPLIEDPTKYFLRSIRTESGAEYGF